MTDPIAKLSAPGADKTAEMLDRHRRELEQAIIIATNSAYALGKNDGYLTGYAAGHKDGIWTQEPRSCGNAWVWRMTPRLLTVSGEPIHARADGDRIVIYGPHIHVSLTMDEFRAFALEQVNAVHARNIFVEVQREREVITAGCAG